MRFLALLFAALLAGGAAASAPAAAQSTNGCQGFSGHWLTTWPGGTTKMHIVGNKALYSYHGGILTGHVEGGVYSGTYAQSDGNTGTFRFVLSEGGNHFSGWYSPQSSPDQRVTWTGVCEGPP